jgi:hypothetical protein
MIKTKLVIIISLLIIIGVPLQSQSNTTEKLIFEDKVQIWLTENKVPAVGIGIIEDGKIKYAKVIGEL